MARLLTPIPTARFLFLMAMILALGSAPARGQPAKDLKGLDPALLPGVEDFVVEPVTPKKDPKTGFIVGGKNNTSLLRTLPHLNGIKIAILEKDMRPGASSSAGFLGQDEKLLEILAADNQFIVDELSLTHQELAKHLHAMGTIWFWQTKNKQPEAPFLYHGRKFKVKGMTARGKMPSPFADGTESGSNVTVFNLDNGKKVGYALLVPHMIERYGFYEGKGTRYRVDPRDILAVFDFLKTKTSKR